MRCCNFSILLTTIFFSAKTLFGKVKEAENGKELTADVEIFENNENKSIISRKTGPSVAAGRFTSVRLCTFALPLQVPRHA